jgi:hypothetical protein
MWKIPQVHELGHGTRERKQDCHGVGGFVMRVLYSCKGDVRDLEIGKELLATTPSELSPTASGKRTF